MTQEACPELRKVTPLHRAEIANKGPPLLIAIVALKHLDIDHCFQSSHLFYHEFLSQFGSSKGQLQVPVYYQVASREGGA